MLFLFLSWSIFLCCLKQSAISRPALVMARGHRIGEVSELPLVVSDGLESITKTKQAVEALKNLGCGDDLQKANLEI